MEKGRRREEGVVNVKRSGQVRDRPRGLQWEILSGSRGGAAVVCCVYVCMYVDGLVWFGLRRGDGGFLVYCFCVCGDVAGYN